MCPTRVCPQRPKRLVRLDAACASGHRFFFLMHDNVEDSDKDASGEDDRK